MRSTDSGRPPVRPAAGLATSRLASLAATSVVTEFDEAGTWLAAVSAHATARDYARFGLLYLRGGAWDAE